MDPLIVAVEASAGVGLAAVAGAAAARWRPAWAPASAAALGLVALASALLPLLGAPLHPIASLVAVAFLSGAWAFAPAGPPSRASHAAGAAAGLGLVAALSALSALDAWWAMPLAAMGVAFLVALWRARPDLLRRGAPPGEPAAEERVE